MQPTPYPEVNIVPWIPPLSGTRGILGERFIGMYLIGSLALGDFSHQRSDIDYVVITDTSRSERIISRLLQAMHVCFDASGSPWAAIVIEAIYAPLGAITEWL